MPAGAIASGPAFPPAPAQGDCFYRTDLNEFYIWNGTAWVPWRTRGPALVVAAVNSLDPTLADPAYRCDGVSDQVQINAAMTAVLAAGGGTVRLLEGTFTVDGSIVFPGNNIALVGAGAGTVITIPDGHDAGINIISATSKDYLLIANLRVDGNRANQTAGAMYGVYFDTVTHSRLTGCLIENIFGGTSIYLTASPNCIISNNTSRNNNERGIQILSSSHETTITRNLVAGNDETGIETEHSDKLTITGNTVVRNSFHGIHIDHADYCTVANNTVAENGRHGIMLFGYSSNNTIASNTIIGNSQTTDNTYDGIFLSTDGDYNNIHGNTVRHAGGANQHRYGIRIDTADCDGNLVQDNDLYLAGRTANFSDAGTDTKFWDRRIGLLNAPASNESGDGIFTIDTVGENVTAGEILYMAATGKYLKADADAVGTMPALVMAMEAISADAAGKLLHIGYFRHDTWTWALGAGAANLLFASITPGAMSQTAPVGSGDQVQVVGYVITEDIVFFSPSFELVEIA